MPRCVGSKRSIRRCKRWSRERAIGGYDHAARYVPSAATQLRRQQRLPDADALREALQAALAGTPFRPDVFEPFVQDVERARTLPPLVDRGDARHAASARAWTC